MYTEPESDVPAGYDEKETLGRPKEKVSNINTQYNETKPIKHVHRWQQEIIKMQQMKWNLKD